MAYPFHIPVTAAQIGTYFVGNYYQVLQQQPDLVHQFYSNSSTMLRIDSNSRETASGMLQIHALVVSLKFSGIEIKTAHCLESWTGGVLVMISGSVQISSHRKFVQTFFLAPQEKGYFILNDIFHFIDEEPIYHHPAVLLSHSNIDSKLRASNATPDPVSNYLLGGEIQAREFLAPSHIREDGPIASYILSDQRLQHVLYENILDDNAAEESNGSLQRTVNLIQGARPTSAEEVADSQQHTYASILAKGKSSQSNVPRCVVKTLPLSEKNHETSTTSPQLMLSSAVESSGTEITDEDEGEIKSVYVRNLPTNVSANEIAEEFKAFGKLSSHGVAIRSRKDVVGVNYAFVEFEDVAGVRNAVEAATVQIAGQQVYIEARRANSYIPSHGGGRGRGRGYQADAPKGRLGSRHFSKASCYVGEDRENYRPRGNGFYQPGPR